MRKGPIKIPVEVLDRTIEFYSGMPDFRSLKLKGHGVVRFQNLFSHLSRVHHFDSVKEFLTYQDNLASTDRVAFHEVEVIGRHNYPHDLHASKGDAAKSFLELDLADGTGQTKLLYLYSGSSRVPHDPVIYARKGDKVQVYAADYKGGDKPLLLRLNFHMRNDAHYKRLQNL